MGEHRRETCRHERGRHAPDRIDSLGRERCFAGVKHYKPRCLYIIEKFGKTCGGQRHQLSFWGLQKERPLTRGLVEADSMSHEMDDVEATVPQAQPHTLECRLLEDLDPDQLDPRKSLLDLLPFFREIQ